MQLKGLVGRLLEPTPLRGDDRWRIGKFQLEHRDKGSKWHSNWQINWGEHYRIIEFTRLDFGVGFYLFSDSKRTSVNLFGLWIKTPIKSWREPKDILEKWGFSYLDKAMHFGWGARSKIVYMPWDFDHIDKEHKVLMADGETWETVESRWRMPDGTMKNPMERLSGERWKSEYPYNYLLRSGKVQRVTATVQVERRAWRRRGLPAWLPLFQKKSTTIDVAFAEEVGERSGSWKGGCTGCGYEMKPGERPGDTLKRMERERVFD